MPRAVFSGRHPRAPSYLLVGQRVGDAEHVARAVLDTDQDRSTGGVRERDDRSHQAGRRREVALELEGLAFVAAEEGGDVHQSEFY